MATKATGFKIRNPKFEIRNNAKKIKPKDKKSKSETILFGISCFLVI
jgi:hypothetical protein